LITGQILLASSITEVWRIVRRICAFISGLKGVTSNQIHGLTFADIIIRENTVALYYTKGTEI